MHDAAARLKTGPRRVGRICAPAFHTDRPDALGIRATGIARPGRSAISDDQAPAGPHPAEQAAGPGVTSLFDQPYTQCFAPNGPPGTHCLPSVHWAESPQRHSPWKHLSEVRGSHTLPQALQFSLSELTLLQTPPQHI